MCPIKAWHSLDVFIEIPVGMLWGKGSLVWRSFKKVWSITW